MEERPCKRTRLIDSDEHNIQCGSRGHCYGQIHIGGNATVQLGDRNVERDSSPKDAETVTAARAKREKEELENEKAKLKKERFDSLLALLSFGRMQFRVNNVKRAMLSTCEWLFEHPAFRKWYDISESSDTSGFLWIKGKPGSGKSTLMKATLEWIERNASKERNVIPFFFHARSTLLEKTPLGLYRYLVHHLLSVYPPLRDVFLDRFRWKDPRTAGDSWTKEELQEFLFESIEKKILTSFYMLVDALDEVQYDEDVRDMIEFLVDLIDRASMAGCQMQLCLSSRHYPHVSIGKGLELVVEDQVEHAHDIDIYVGQRLKC